MNMFKMALLGGAALAVSAAGAQADELTALKAQMESLNARVASMEAAPSVPAGYSLLTVSEGAAPVVPGVDAIDAASYGTKATVISVLPRAQLSTSVDARCVGAASVAPSDEVAVVKYRVGRAPYLQAFAIPGGRSLHKGDTVVVHPSQCLMKDAASAA